MVAIYVIFCMSKEKKQKLAMNSVERKEKREKKKRRKEERKRRLEEEKRREAERKREEESIKRNRGSGGGASHDRGRVVGDPVTYMYECFD